MSAPRALAMFRPRIAQAKPIRVGNVQQRFLNMQATRRLARPVPVSTPIPLKFVLTNFGAERRA
jgi:hypothetical protein